MAQPLRIKTDSDERIYNTEAYFLASQIIWTPSQTLIPIDGSNAGKRKVGNNVDTYTDLDFENSGSGGGSYSPPIPQSDVTDLEDDLTAIVAQAALDRHPVITFSTNTTTDADPGQATIRFNNGTIASVTEIALSDADSESIDKGDLNSRCAGILQLRTVASAATIEFLITAIVHTSWTRYTVTYLKGSLPTNGTAMTYKFLPSNAATPAVTTALAGKADKVNTYAAALSQSGTGNIAATVIQNTYVGTPVFARTGVGTHTLTLAGAWTAGTTVDVTNSVVSLALDERLYINYAVASTDVIDIICEDATRVVQDIDNANFSIRIQS